MAEPATPSQPAALTAGRIDVWLAAPRTLEAEEEQRALGLLSDDERLRWRRFARQASRDQYLAAHVVLRKALSRYVDAPANAWRFGANAYGRPHVLEPSGAPLDFNLSHTEGLVAVAVSGARDIGVDVENVSRDADLEQLAAAFFAKAEAEAVELANAADKRETFFALWTLKEAYIKARGMGLSLGLDGYAFDISADAPAIAFDDRCTDDPGRWRFWRFRPTPLHALALAAPSHVEEARIIWTDVG